MIIIKGLNKAEVLRELYNKSTQDGYGFDITTEQAQEILNKTTLIGELEEKTLCVDLSSDYSFNEAYYDKYNGEGMARKIIADLRKKVGKPLDVDTMFGKDADIVKIGDQIIDQEEYDRKVQQICLGNSYSTEFNTTSNYNADGKQGLNDTPLYIVLTVLIAIAVGIAIFAIYSSRVEAERQMTKAEGYWTYDFSYTYDEKSDGTTDYSDSYDDKLNLSIYLARDECNIYYGSEQATFEWSIKDDGTIRIKDIQAFTDMHPELTSVLDNLEYQEDSNTLYSFIPTYDNDKDYVAHVFTKE